MEGYEQSLHINDSAFESMRADADRVLQRLLKNMVEKDSLEGKVTITIDVSLIQEYIPNRDPNIEGETRRTLTPKLSHKVGSVMQIKNEAKGDTNYDGMEMVWDDERKEYVLRPVANTEQMTIFDADFRCVNDEEGEAGGEEGQPALEGRMVAALPGPIEDAEYREVGEDATEEADGEEEVVEEPAAEEDMSDEFGGMPEPLPFTEGDDEYDYEEPGGEDW